MNKRLLNSFIVIAFILIAIGILFAFINLETISINIKNDGFVSAIFSLSGIIFFFTALMYQIKEYKLQVEELKKSVEAQTKSSEALDEQKRILIEQNVNSLIFGMIDNFNSFKERNDIDNIINGLITYYQNLITPVISTKVKFSGLKERELNAKIAEIIKETFCNSIEKHKQYLIIKKYIQFVHNILYLIKDNKVNMSRDSFTTFFFSQLNTNETIIVYLSNLVNPPIMPFYENLKWDYYTTKEIVDMFEGNEMANRDLSIDYVYLTEIFSGFNQNN